MNLSLKLLLGSLAAASIAFAGCSAADPSSNDDAEDANVSHDELNSLSAQLKGTWEWRSGDSGKFVDFEQVVLGADGTYTAKVDSGLVDPAVRCIKFPCTLPESGAWSAYKSSGQTKIRFRPHGEPTRSYSATVKSGALTLTRLGESTTLFAKSTGPTCATVRCAAGYHCEMKGINGGAIAACIKDPVAAPPCQKSGCSGQICADHNVISTCEWRPEYACYQSATCERQADGACGWTKTAALTACLGGQ